MRKADDFCCNWRLKGKNKILFTLNYDDENIGNIMLKLVLDPYANIVSCSENVACLLHLLHISYALYTTFIMAANIMSPDQTAPRGAV